MSYLNFIPAGVSASGKTKLWGIQSLGGNVLGMVSWFAAWRKYTFSPEHGTIFDPSCLREIADFVEAKTKEHKS
jgi:hypothetical protein